MRDNILGRSLAVLGLWLAVAFSTAALTAAHTRKKARTPTPNLPAAIAIPCDTKLLNVALVNGKLWLTTRMMRQDEHPEIYTFAAFGSAAETALQECRSDERVEGVIVED